MMTLLARWGRPKSKRNVSHLLVTVYTRAECCCCHKAIDVLNDYRRKYGFRVEAVDVDSDPALATRYGLSVPVVEIGGKVRFKGVVNPVLLDRLLLAESRGR